MNDLITELKLYNLEAEQEVMSGMVAGADENTMMIVSRYRVKADWFFDHQNKAIAKIILDMNKLRLPISIPAILEYIQRTKAFIPVSAMELQQHLIRFATLTYFETHIKILQDLYHKRKIIEVAYGVSEEISGEKTPAEAISDIKHSLEEILNDRPEQIRTADDIKQEIKSLHTIAQTSGTMGVPSRWLQVQEITGGYPRGKLSIVAARPSIGKTTWACNETRYMVEGEGVVPVGWISLDDDQTDIYRSIAGEMAEVNLMPFRTGRATLEDHAKFDAALDTVLGYPIHITEQKMTIDHICNWIRYMSDKKGIGIFWVDFIQIIKINDYMVRWSDHQKVTYWSHELKSIAKETNTAIVALCQINRGGDPPENIREGEAWKYVPKLKHLKEAGALEEDADLVIILYNDPMRPNADQLNVVPLVADVAKNKKGPKGRKILRYRKDRQRIEHRRSDDD